MPIAAPELSPDDLGQIPGALEDLVPTPVLPDGPEDLPLPSQPPGLPAGDLFAADGPQTKPFPFTEATSNALLFGADVTDTGKPLVVFGPQTGYFAPQLLVEKDVHGPGIDARGVSFAGTDLWVQLGRGVDYAWSATSSHVDNVDQRVLRLCDTGGGDASTDSDGYLVDGECREIEVVDQLRVAKPSAAGDPTGITGADPSDPAALAELLAGLGPEDVLVRKYFEREYGPIRSRGSWPTVRRSRSRTTARPTSRSSSVMVPPERPCRDRRCRRGGELLRQHRLRLQLVLRRRRGHRVRRVVLCRCLPTVSAMRLRRRHGGLAGLPRPDRPAGGTTPASNLPDWS